MKSAQKTIQLLFSQPLSPLSHWCLAQLLRWIQVAYQIGTLQTFELTSTQKSRSRVAKFLVTWVNVIKCRRTISHFIYSNAYTLIYTFLTINKMLLIYRWRFKPTAAQVLSKQFFSHLWRDKLWQSESPVSALCNTLARKERSYDWLKRGVGSLRHQMCSLHLHGWLFCHTDFASSRVANANSCLVESV